jgi:hypothetical protein
VQSLSKIAASVSSRHAQVTDLRVQWKAQNDGGLLVPDSELLFDAGGEWNKLSKQWTGNGATLKELGLHGGQLAGARWLVEWFRAKAEGRKLLLRGRPVYTGLFHGGRRAGKTDLAAKAGVTYAIMRPGTWTWLISSSQPKTEELAEAVKDWLPVNWYDWRGAPYYQFTLPNGSVIWLRTAYDPEDLKRGRCDFAVFNEGQEIAEKAYGIVRAATADNGGLTLIAANPPDAPIGYWIEKLFEEARAGKRQAVEFFFDNKLNPHVDYESLESMREDVDDRTYRREVLGEFLPRQDVVFHAWKSDGQDANVRPLPQVGAKDVTRAFTRKNLGREFHKILGLDLQRNPVCAVELRAYEDPADVDGEPLLFAVEEIIVENGYEADLSAALLARGYDQATTALIIDASGSWQGIDREKKHTSFDLFREYGWRFLYKPDERLEKNPDILQRVAATNAHMKNAAGKRRLFSSPALLALNLALKLWENRNGVPYRRSIYAHLCDAISYVVWRFYPRALDPKHEAKPGDVEVLSLKPDGPRLY